MAWPLCLVRCRQCLQEIHFPSSIYFSALFVWLIISCSVLFCTSKVIRIILSEPEMIRSLVLIFGALVGLTVGGFFCFPSNLKLDFQKINKDVRTNFNNHWIIWLNLNQFQKN